MRRFWPLLLLILLFWPTSASAESTVEFEICDAGTAGCLSSDPSLDYGVRFASNCSDPASCEWRFECSFSHIGGASWCWGRTSKVRWLLTESAYDGAFPLQFAIAAKEGADACYKDYDATDLEIGKPTTATRRNFGALYQLYVKQGKDECHWPHILRIKDPSGEAIVDLDPRLIIPRKDAPGIVPFLPWLGVLVLGLIGIGVVVSVVRRLRKADS